MVHSCQCSVPMDPTIPGMHHWAVLLAAKFANVPNEALLLKLWGELCANMENLKVIFQATKTLEHGSGGRVEPHGFR